MGRPDVARRVLVEETLEFPLEFRRQAAQLVLTSHRSMTEIDREPGVHHKTLGNCVSDERARAADGAAVVESERD